jgi:hypothetical protein
VFKVLLARLAQKERLVFKVLLEFKVILALLA